MLADKKSAKNHCMANCSLKTKAETDFKSLETLAKEILALLDSFSKEQDLEIHQIAEYSETSFRNSPKL
jgi:hypothetical protein